MTDVEETWVADLRAEMDRQYQMGHADGVADLLLERGRLTDAQQEIQCPSWLNSLEEAITVLGRSPGFDAERWEDLRDLLAALRALAEMEGQSDG